VRQVALEGLVAGHLGGEQGVELTGQPGALGVVVALGEGVEAVARVLGVDRAGVGLALRGLRRLGVLGRGVLVNLGAGARGLVRSLVVRRGDQLEVAGAQLVALRDRIGLGDAPELGVGEAVAVRVLQDDVPAELLRLAGVEDDAVVDRDDRCAFLRVDVDPSTCGRT
jgi:hypothetical protein